MIDNYRGGYFKALLDIRVMFERDDFWIGVKSAKKARKQVASFLSMVLTVPLMLDNLMQRGSVNYRISKDGECLPIQNKKDFVS